MRKKIIPPVTPKIVQTHPRQQLVRYVLLIFAFLLTAWLSYDYGQSRTPGNDGAPVTQSSDAKQHITALEQERDTLRQQVAELERSVRQANKALASKGAPGQARQRVVSTPPKVPKPAPATTVADATDNTLTLNDIRLDKTGSENVFRIGFSVMHGGNSNDRVVGTIWIAVNGFSGDKPTRLSFNTLSSDNRTYVKMGFDQLQLVSEDIALPDGFRPGSIIIEAKPYGEKYTGTSGKFAWDTSGEALRP